MIANTIPDDGPSRRFIALTRNPDLPPPARFEPTQKREGDIVIGGYKRRAA